MAFLLKERKLNQSSFADLLRTKPQVIQTYISGRSKPPLEELLHWCETLKLSKLESEKMRWLALESYTPTVVWEKIAGLDLDVASLRQEKVELGAQLTESRAEAANLRSKSAQLQAESAHLHAEFDKLNAETAQLRAETAELRRQRDDLAAKIAELTKRMTRIDG
jgi:chromosome segregation ATPase